MPGIQDFTDATRPLIDFLQDKFPGDALYISDVTDDMGRQCVDLVQEGGGIHGIALAGYTYVLESMGITFNKCAGTSAGAINTMLLCGTFSSGEIQFLKDNLKADAAAGLTGGFDLNSLDPANYHPTRSEKLLEYLAGKDLREIVDGHPTWRNVLLNMFTGKRKMENVKSVKKSLFRSSIVFAVSLLLLIVSAVLLRGTGAVAQVAGWISMIAILLLIIAVSVLATLAWKGRILWLVAEKLGINPGNDFQQWIEKILTANHVVTIAHLRSKMEAETYFFNAHYAPRDVPAPADKDYFVDLVKDAFDHSFPALQRELARLEAQSAAGEAEARDIDRLWDDLVREAKNLPGGNPAKEDLAEARAGLLMPLFLRTIQLMDISCKYVPREHPGPTSSAGPYARELTIISTDISNEIKVEFPAMHKMYWGRDYSMSPACYVRASMAVPAFFTPYRIPYNDKRRNEMDEEWMQFMRVEKRHDNNRVYAGGAPATLFIDGGALSNFPINIYATPEMPIPRKPTLGIKLQFEEETISKDISNELGEVSSIISTMRYFYDRDFLSKHDMYKRTVRSIDTGQVHWLNFALTQAEKIELFYRGAYAATLFLISNHPDFAARETEWYSLLEEYGKSIRTANNTDGKNPLQFRNEDLENPDIRFRWPQYRLNRLLDLPRLKHQREKLKRFPQ